MSHPTADRVKEFLDLYGSDFAYANDIVAIMSGPSHAQITVSDAVPLPDLARIYRTRARWLTWCEQNGKLQPHVLPTLPAEARSLSEALDAASSQTVRLWDVRLTVRISWLIFELREERRIAGVLKTQGQPGWNPPL